METTTTEIARKEFEAKNATKYRVVYYLEKYTVKNGYWYRFGKFVPTIRYHSDKCYRSEAAARKAYENSIAHEQWLNDKS